MRERREREEEREREMQITIICCLLEATSLEPKWSRELGR
jgi:hypothetical protein